MEGRTRCQTSTQYHMHSSIMRHPHTTLPPHLRRRRLGPFLFFLLSILLILSLSNSNLSYSLPSSSSPSSSSSSSSASFSLFPLVTGFPFTPPVSRLTFAPLNKSRTIRLGFLGSTNLPNTNTQTGGAPALFAARLAVQQLNEQSILLPNTHIELLNNNTNSDAGTGNFMAYEQINSLGVVGMIGEYNSGVSIAVAYPSRFYRIPMISYGSTSPEFTTFHDTQFPYFLRLTPSQNQESQLLAYLIHSLGWSRVGLIHTTDSAGIAGAQSFSQVSAKLGIQVVVSSAFALNASNLDVYYAMNNVKQSGATILLFIGAITDMQSIIRVCTLGSDDGRPPLGLYGTGYQWIGLHSYIYSTLYTDAAGSIVPHQYEFAQGLIGLQNYADLDSAVYHNYLDSWKKFPPQPDLPSVIPTNPSSMTAPGHFSYDTVWFYAYALHRMEHEFGIDLNDATPGQRQLFLQVLKNVTFNGVSGPVSVDKNGDRFAPFDIINFDGKQLRTIGQVNAAGDVQFTTDEKTILFMNGRNNKAPDRIIRGIYHLPSSTRIGMLVATIVCICIVFLAIWIVFYLRDTAIMKAASPPFIQLMLFGLLLLLSAEFPRIYENEINSTRLCEADLFLTNLGYTLIVGSLLVKTYRVDAIFRLTKFQQRILTNCHLLILLGVLCFCQTVICIGLMYGQPFDMDLDGYNSTMDYYYCSSGDIALHTGVVMSWRFFLLAVTAVYAFRIRSIPDAFNESKTIFAVVYNLSFLSVLLPIIDEAIGRGKSTGVIAYGASVFTISIATSTIMLAPKLYHYFLLINPPMPESSGHTNTLSQLSSEMNYAKKPPPSPPGGSSASPPHYYQRSSYGSGSATKFVGAITPVAAGGGTSSPPRALPRASNPRNGAAMLAPISPLYQMNPVTYPPTPAPSFLTPPQTNSAPRPSCPITIHLPVSVSSPSTGVPLQSAAVQMSSTRRRSTSPRLHLARGVSQQLMNLLVEQLQQQQQQQQMQQQPHYQYHQPQQPQGMTPPSTPNGNGSHTSTPVQPVIPTPVTIPTSPSPVPSTSSTLPAFPYSSSSLTSSDSIPSHHVGETHSTSSTDNSSNPDSIYRSSADAPFSAPALTPALDPIPSPSLSTFGPNLLSAHISSPSVPHDRHPNACPPRDARRWPTVAVDCSAIDSVSIENMNMTESSPIELHTEP